jgi:hypothetical protein
MIEQTIELSSITDDIKVITSQTIKSGFEEEDVGNLLESFLSNIGFGQIKCIHEDAIKKLQEAANDKCPF